MRTEELSAQITRAYLDTDNLSAFLRACESIFGFHLAVLDTDLRDPSITDPPENDRWYGEVMPYRQLTVHSALQGCLAVEKEAQIDEDMASALELVADYLEKMPEISTKIGRKDEAYLAGISELLFSRDNDRMISVRAQIGLSGLSLEDKSNKYVIINIKNKGQTDTLQQLEYTLRHHYLEDRDILLRQGDTLIVFKRVSPEEMKSRSFTQGLLTILPGFDAVACISDYFSDPVRDFRMRQHFNSNEQVLQYLIDGYRKGEYISTLIYYDDWRMVPLMNAALACPGSSIYGAQQYISQKVKDIIAYDTKNDSEYLKTLYCYLNANFSLTETAERLHVHRNTVVYRVKRMQELFDINFSNANECFRLNLSCRLHKIASCIEASEKEN